MRFTSSVPLLSLALSFSGTDASPIGAHELEQRQETIVVEDIDFDGNMDAWCSISTSIGDMDKAQQALSTSQLDAWVQKFLSEENHGAVNWLNNFHRLALNDPGADTEGAANCAQTALTCEPGVHRASCETYFQMKATEPTKWPRYAFWIFKSVRGVHDKMKIMLDRLRDTTLVQGLRINTMANELGANLQEDQMDMSGLFNGLGIALSITGTVAGLVPGPGAAVSAAAGIFGTLLDAFEPEPPAERVITLENVEDDLAARFEAATTAIDRGLKTAMGFGRGDSDYQALGQTPGRWESGIANFFSNPFWLLDNNSDAINKMLDQMTHLMQLKLVDGVLVALGLEIVARNGEVGWSTNKDECEWDNNGRRWIEVNGESWCFGLSLKGAQDGEHYEQSYEDGPYAAMHKYGITALSEFYKNALDCDRVGGSGAGAKPRVDELVEGLPRCFYSIPVKRARKAYWPHSSNQFWYFTPFYQSLREEGRA